MTNGSPATNVSIAASAATQKTAERRQALLRRLNQITQQRSLLQQRTSHENPESSTANGHKQPEDPVNLDPIDGRDDVAKPRKNSPRNSADAISQRTRRESTKVDASTNGKKKRQGTYPKRHRGDAGIESVQEVPPRIGDDAESDSHAIGVDETDYTHNKAGTSRRDSHNSAKHQTTNERKTQAGRRDRGKSNAAQGSDSKKGPQASAPSSPTSGTRGSGRVRTPSVLLASQPGEKVPALPKNSAAKNRQAAYCLRIVKEMLRLKDGFGFSKPIDQLWSVDQLPGYFEMITNPMDLDTVRERLETGHYASTLGKEEVEEVVFDIENFTKDMKLIFENARTYNRPGDTFFEAANRLSEKFESKMKQLPSLEQVDSSMRKQKKRKKVQITAASGNERKNESFKKRKTTNQGSDSDGHPPPRKGSEKKKASQPVSKGNKSTTGAARKKRPPNKPDPIPKKNTDSMSTKELETRLGALKRQRTVNEAGSNASSPSAGGASFMAQAQALYHIEMTYEEKVQLSHNVGKLPPDKLQKVFSLATRNKASSMEVNNNEEVELDIGSLNNRTLREIEAYVNQTLFRKKKNLPGNMPNVDIFHMTNTEIGTEIQRITTELKKRNHGNNNEAELSADGTTDKKGSSFYDSDSSSDSDSDGSGSSSSNDSSGSDASDSSDDEPDDEMQRRREKNLAHHRAMQAAGTPLASPSYQSSGRSGQ